MEIMERGRGTMNSDEKAGNDMKMTNISKARNFEEPDEFGINLHNFHITDFWVNPKNDESREISAYESREMEACLMPWVLAGVELKL